MAALEDEPRTAYRLPLRMCEHGQRILLRQSEVKLTVSGYGVWFTAGRVVDD
jgi:hypothetical protein